MPRPTDPRRPGRLYDDERPPVVPVPVLPHRSAAATPFREVAFGDAEHEHLQRLNDAERRLLTVVDAAREAEEQREAEFRRNEEDRHRTFMEHEGRRDEQAEDARAGLLQGIPEGIPENVAEPRPRPPIVSDLPSELHVPSEHQGQDGASIFSVRSAAQEAASRHANEMLETIRLEREEIAHERELAAAEREHLRAEAEEQRALLSQARDERIRELEEELAKVRGELENERQQRITEEEERRERERQEFVERDAALREQLADITNLVNDQREMCERKKVLMDERWEEKQMRRAEKDSQMSDLRDMFQRLQDDVATDRLKAEEARQLAESKPGILAIPLLSCHLN